MIASAVKTPKGYVPLLRGKLRGSDRTGPQKTKRLRGVYSSREWAVAKAQAFIDRIAAEREAREKALANRKKALANRPRPAN
jgi:IS5 family transposase